MTYLFITTYLNATKTFYLINNKNLPGKLYATTVPGFFNNDLVNDIENVLLDFFVSKVTFSVTTDNVPYF